MLTSLCHTEHINHITYFHTFTYTFHIQILYIKIIFQKIPYDTLNILTHPKNKKRNPYYIYIYHSIYLLSSNKNFQIWKKIFRTKQITELFKNRNYYYQIYLYFHNNLFQTKNIIPRRNWSKSAYYLLCSIPLQLHTSASNWKFSHTHAYTVRKKKERKKEKDSKKMPLYKKNQLRNSRRSSSLKTSSSADQPVIPCQGRGGRKYRCALIPVEQIASEIW